MNQTEAAAEKLVSTAILAEPEIETRRLMARALAAYAIGAVVAMEGPEAASRVAYAMADSTVGME